MDNIKLIRKRQGLTQQQLADRLHVVRQTISKWEKGESAPDGDMLPAVAEALGVPLEELMGLPTPEPWYYRLKKPLFIILVCLFVLSIGADIKVRQLQAEYVRFDMYYTRWDIIFTAAMSFFGAGAVVCLIPWAKRRPVLGWAFVALAVIFALPILMWNLQIWKLTLSLPLLCKKIIFTRAGFRTINALSGALFFSGVGLLGKK